MAKTANTKQTNTKQTNTNTNTNTNTDPVSALAQTMAAVANAVQAAPAAPAQRGAASQAKLQAAIANGQAASGATALAHAFGNNGPSVGNTGKLATGTVTVTAKGQAYQPKAGYNANAWHAICTTLQANPAATTAQLAQAIGHGGAAHCRYQIKLGHLAVQA